MSSRDSRKLLQNMALAKPSRLAMRSKPAEHSVRSCSTVDVFISLGDVVSITPAQPLLDKRLIVVTGKGGTGKTTVVASLALTAAQLGKRVLVIETSPDEHIPQLLAPNSGTVGYAGKTLLPGIDAMRIDPYDALAEYLGTKVGVRAPLQFMIQNTSFRQFMDATPGWRELITLGKIWQLERLCDTKERPLYDLLLVDAPATGHGLIFLEVPHVITAAVRAGPLHRNAESVEALLRDAKRSVLLPVALAEELPARETVELVARVREKMSAPLACVVVNSVMPAPFPPGLETLDEFLERLPQEQRIAGLPPLVVMARCAKHLRARFELNTHYIDMIRNETQLPVVTLPQIQHGIVSIADLRKLAAALGRSAQVVSQ